MPDGLDVLLYCRSKNSFVSTRVAAVIRRHGMNSIYSSQEDYQRGKR